MKDLIKKIWNFIVSIPQDKLLHMMAAMLINLFSIMCFIRFTPFWWCLLIGFTLSTAALVAKEIYDKHHSGHSVEFMDIVYGEVGVVLIDLALMIGLA